MITSSLLCITALCAAPSTDAPIADGSFACAPIADAPFADAPFQDLPLDQAFAAAKKDGKLVMIDFFTTWCAPCKRLDKLTWTDKDVQDWVAKTAVAIKLDAEKEVEIAKRYHVEAYPTILFLKNDGSEVDRIIAFKQPAEFLEEAKSLIAGKSAVERVREKMAGKENDPMQREQLGNALAGRGKNEEALTEYLWCFDHGLEHDWGYSGVRVSFLLSDIARLGKKYPPAWKALEDRRDSAESALFSEKGSSDNAKDVFALNDTLGAQDRNIAAWDRLKKDGRVDREMRIVVAHRLIEPLVKARRYSDALEVGGDLADRTRSEIQRARPTGKSKDSRDADIDEAIAAAGAQLAVLRIGAYYEAAIGAQQSKMADSIAEQLIAFSPRSQTYVALIDHATRAGDLDAAKTIAERGIAAVPEKERPILQDALKRMPEKK
jgi:thiol-disulfide isomerase/thioredoxin